VGEAAAAAPAPAHPVEVGVGLAADREGAVRALQEEIFAVPVAAGELDRVSVTEGALMAAATVVVGNSAVGPLGRRGSSADETGITAGSSRSRGLYVPVRRRTAASAALS
jgi:hypothetical protein